MLASLTSTATALSGESGGEQDDRQPGVFGTLQTADEEPLKGVEVTVSGEDSGFQETVETDADGEWSVDVPRSGTYVIEINEDTLPEDVGLKNPDNNPTTITVRDNRRRVLFPMGESARGGFDFPFRPLAQRLVDGIKFGLIIAITSVGLSLIFGTTGLINFAHGEFVTLGAIVAWFLNVQGPQLHLVFAAILATAVGGVFAGGLEAGMFARLRARRVGGFQFLVITIGLSLLMRHVLVLWYGSRQSPYAQYTVQQRIRWGPVAATPRDLAVMALSAAILVGVAMMLQRTRMGKATRAVADNPDLAESSGINVARVILVVWIVGGALAAIGGVLQGLVTAVEWTMGFRLLLLMFAAVILGGLGTAYGAMVGGLVIGIVSQVSTVWLRAELQHAWALLVLVLVLLIRPQGILGRKERLG
ncbi:MAG: branched-chain amino acid ABC transporter permease [Actinomycetota bacterium]|nr:branched-chain amino acid ABC transporter permease [Actinomycetota bacterium]